MINLKRLDYDEQNKIIEIINNDQSLQDTFPSERKIISRILNSSYVALIKHKNIPIGFIMLVYNNKENNHELDMGIKKRYQNKGYGTEALNLLKKLLTNEKLKITIQVKTNNIPAIKTVEKNKFLLKKHDNKYRYYSN